MHRLAICGNLEWSRLVASSYINRFLRLRVGEECIANFPFSFIVWDNTYKERAGRETGSKHTGEQHALRETVGRSTTETIQRDALGNEVAYFVEMDGEKRYVMGEEILEPGGFHKQVAQRFGQVFPQAREQAVQIVEQTDRATLASRRKFYEEPLKIP